MDTRNAETANIPFTSAELPSLYPGLTGLNNKASRMCGSGELIRLKRGLFVRRPTADGQRLSLGLIANHLYPPSFVSMQSALRFYGLIPESVQSIQSMTLCHTRYFATPVGRFEFINCQRDVFGIGVTQATSAGAVFVIATPERALCDTVAGSAGVCLRHLTEAERYLTADLRLDMDSFLEMDPGIMEAYARLGKKGGSVMTLIRLLRHERAL